jgi:hypothetical protein
MDYLTQYYKTRSEQLQEELNQLNENIFDDAYHLYHYLFGSKPGYLRNNTVPDRTITRPGRKPTRVPYGRPTLSDPDGTRPMHPPGMDPGTNNPWYPGPDRGGQPMTPGPYPHYYNPDGSVSNQEVRPERR